MGILRFLLATCVLAGHAGHHVGFLTPYYAVQVFFVISGFYMSLIAEKYNGYPGLFYVNRYMRLVVSYWVVALVTLITCICFTTSSPPPLYVVDALKSSFPKSLMLVNLTIFGQDLVEFFNINGRPASGWLLVPQGWSLGAELCFYILVPFLVGRRTQILMLIIIAAVVLRIAIITSDLPFFPWQQRFFPVEIAFFIIGLLSHRLYLVIGPYLRNAHGYIALSIAAMITIFIGYWQWANAPCAIGSFLLAMIFFTLLPFLFFISKNSSFDRLIGEFSYPIYLWHIFVLSFIVAPGSSYQLVLFYSCMLSLPLIFFVEKPLERWRQTRLLHIKKFGQIKPFGIKRLIFRSSMDL